MKEDYIGDFDHKIFGVLSQKIDLDIDTSAIFVVDSYELLSVNVYLKIIEYVFYKTRFIPH